MKIFNCKIYTMNHKDEIFENGWVEIENGKIVNLGEGETNFTESDFDAEGKFLFPGFIDAHCHLGIIGNALGFESDDCNEHTDPVTPHLRVIDAINPFDFCFKEAREAGITSVISSPGSANPIGGEIYALKTNGRCIDEMIIKSVGIKFALGENPKSVYNSKEETPMTRMATVSIIREALFKTKRYLEDLAEYEEDSEENSPPDFDLKNESLAPLLKREKQAHFHCHRADDIFTAIRIAEEFNLDLVLIHATEAHLIADILKDKNIKTVIGPIICDRSKPELKNLNIKNSAELIKNQIPTAICTDHPETPIQYLSLTAGLAIRGGLDFYSALKSITIDAAKITGISSKVGSIEIGKDADIQLYMENPFNTTSTPAMVMIDGNIIEKL